VGILTKAIDEYKIKPEEAEIVIQPKRTKKQK